MPKIDRHPGIELVSPSTIASLRYEKNLSSLNGEVVVAGGQTASQQETVSLYDDATQTIYLPKGWSGTTDVEVSILVHEMVHHFQNLLGLKYECAQEREKLAYTAQDRWLVRSGRSLASDFDFDPFFAASNNDVQVLRRGNRNEQVTTCWLVAKNASESEGLRCA
jgi:predicted metalloprotease